MHVECLRDSLLNHLPTLNSSGATLHSNYMGILVFKKRRGGGTFSELPILDLLSASTTEKGKHQTCEYQMYEIGVKANIKKKTMKKC